VILGAELVGGIIAHRVHAVQRQLVSRRGTGDCAAATPAELPPLDLKDDPLGLDLKSRSLNPKRHTSGTGGSDPATCQCEAMAPNANRKRMQERSTEQ
jgi:hypothetical protein